MKRLSLEQMENTKGGKYSAFFCGLAIATFGIAAASLVLASGGTAAVLLAGVGYSLATPGLAVCFMD